MVNSDRDQLQSSQQPGKAKQVLFRNVGENTRASCSSSQFCAIVVGHHDYASLRKPPPNSLGCFNPVQQRQLQIHQYPIRRVLLVSGDRLQSIRALKESASRWGDKASNQPPHFCVVFHDQDGHSLVASMPSTATDWNRSLRVFGMWVAGY